MYCANRENLKILATLFKSPNANWWVTFAQCIFFTKGLKWKTVSAINKTNSHNLAEAFLKLHSNCYGLGFWQVWSKRNSSIPWLGYYKCKWELKRKVHKHVPLEKFKKDHILCFMLNLSINPKSKGTLWPPGLAWQRDI